MTVLKFKSLDNYELKFIINKSDNLMLVNIFKNLILDDPNSVVISRNFNCAYYEDVFFTYDRLTKKYFYINKLVYTNGLHDIMFRDTPYNPIDILSNETLFENNEYIKINLFNFPELDSYRNIKDILE